METYPRIPEPAFFSVRLYGLGLRVRVINRYVLGLEDGGCPFTPPPPPPSKKDGFHRVQVPYKDPLKVLRAFKVQGLGTRV